MKYQEALEKINDSLNHEWRNHGWRNMSNEEVDRDVSKAWGIIEELADKSTPIKPIENILGTGKYLVKYTHECSKCGNYLEVSNKYCSECGTELDWSDEE